VVQIERSLVRSQLVSVDFSLTKNPSDRTMALGSTQSLTEMSTRSISWGKRRPVRKADNLTPSCVIVTKSENLNFLEPSGPLRALKGTVLSFYFNNKQISLFAVVVCVYSNSFYKNDVLISVSCFMLLCNVINTFVNTK